MRFTGHILPTNSADEALFLVFVSIIITIALIEAFGRLYYRATSYEKSVVNKVTFRRSIPPPYQGVDWANKQFFDEFFGTPPAVNPEGTRIVIHNDVTGKYVNIVNHMRVTTDHRQPEIGRILFFGGSTGYGQVPDYHTIPSYLQRLLNNNGKRYNIYNLSSGSINSAQQFERLRSEQVKKGDIVIFYDGVNDIAQGVFYADPDGWIVGEENRRKIEDIKKRGKTWETIKNFIQPYTSCSRVLFMLYMNLDRAVPAHLKAKNKLNQIVVAAANSYEKTIIDTYSWCKGKGVLFFHFYQPNLFSHGRLSSYEKGLLKYISCTPPGMPKAFIASNPAMQSVVSLVQKRGVASYDISGCLSNRPKGEEYYMDFCHVNHKANEIIAEQM